MKRNVVLLFCLLSCSFFSISQKSEDVLDDYNNYLKQAITYSDLSLYAESISEFNRAIEIAEKYNWSEKRIDTKITLAETFRKTQDLETALEILYNISESEKYPRLHIKKLGRIAAIYNQGDFMQLSKIDSVRYFLDSAMSMALRYKFPSLEASLNNELGYTNTLTSGPKSGRKYLLRAIDLYKQIGDTLNFVGAKINLLNNYSLDGQFKKVPPLRDELLKLVEDNNWYDLEIKLYRAISYYNHERGDSLGYFKEELKAERSTAKFTDNLNSAKMNSYRVLHETEKYQGEAEESQRLAKQKVEELKLQTARTKELIIYLSLFAILIVGFVILWFRERKLKKEVKIANSNYHMLLVESNHRIKNNLQMIISMLQYASKGLTDENSIAFKRISSKIYTISALHKHLYMEVHNERVSVDVFFNEIISSYRNIASSEFIVNKKIQDVYIKSERIIYFGLIFNELLSNTFEHSKQKNKIINIHINKLEDGFEFNYYDNSEHENSNETGIGNILIQQLIRRVEGSKFTFDPLIGQYKFQFDYE